MLRRAAGLLSVLSLVLAGAACSAPKDDGTATAKALAAALSTHTVGSVAFDQPAAEVQKELTGLSKGMGPVWPKVTVDGVAVKADNTARVSLGYSWTIPNVAKPWTYKTAADMKRNGDGWTVTWNPSIVAPQLAAGDQLKISTSHPQRAGILAADGQAIVKDRPVETLGINKDGLTDAQAQASATALAAVVDIDPAAYLAKVKAYGPVAFVDAITLRAEAYSALDQAKLKGIKGFLATPGTLPLAPSRTFAQAVLGAVHEATAEDIKKSNGKVVAGQVVGGSGLQASFDAQLAGTPGVTIEAVPGAAATPTATPTPGAGAPAAGPAAAAKELFTQAPINGRDVKTTLVPALQTAAEDALADVKTPSSIVIMKPSTGAILAAANGPDSNGYNTAFLGRYAPGSTFKIATSLGLFREGRNPQSTLSCTPEFTADGKKFFNAPGYDVNAEGQIPMTLAIAHSCNTAFVSQYQNLGQDKLADAAGALGIGMANDLGLDAFMGSVPRDSAGTEHAASMIGQGNVLVSPLAMATLISSTVKGAEVVPVLVAGHDGKAKPAEGTPVTAKEAEGLRTLMRASVTEGYLTNLADLPGAPAIGKTGTAEFGTDNPPHTHSWVIAAQGDIAVAVFVEDGDLGAITGGPLAKAALEAAAGN
ncbi:MULTISPECIES: penicillin-binding transpeptidase domain-containing protein [unclassified Arthrobacter]|uniref:penicillin-binding transpeptidase domain-containing protein n=1 Tax=unclassified Arthrobacter TaxID=235627 RepID=UPI00159D115F|nr:MULTISPECIES: penicillin-binding transpeptidase domain-containing protein [unclassified Arthrobacter]MCQ9165590.1 penicillin-binding protein [Arthrobacter sp. STN4]NVN00238.1 penicillin-binding protein [Arthrobacter sp. SDTb3-6]